LNKQMSVKKIFMLHALLLLALSISAQPKMTVPAYIHKYKDIAVVEMQKYKIPASITMAQGILESANGNSELARKANNHFGIKCKTEWMGGKYYYDDDAEDECFRMYPADTDSYHDHSVFLTTRDYYKSLFQLNIMDYKSWAYGLKQAGYATEPRYAEMLIKIIEDNKLYRLDSCAMVIIKDSITMNKINTAPIEVVRKTDSLKKVKKIHEIKNNTPDFPDISISQKNREILINNGVKYVLAGKKDTYTTIAEDFGLAAFDIMRYNDIKNNKQLCPGEKVYIEAKKKSSSVEFHVFSVGETMHSISQLYAVQLKELYKKNRMKQGTEPGKGQKVWLKNYMPIY
jgi:hypothetical protein